MLITRIVMAEFIDILNASIHAHAAHSYIANDKQGI